MLINISGKVKDYNNLKQIGTSEKANIILNESLDVANKVIYIII